jgi:hypothetical protein
MFAVRHGVLSGPEMGHTAGMARATHLHGRRNGWGTGTAVLLGVLAVEHALSRPLAQVHNPIHGTAAEQWTMKLC